jgi:hypothetical protein
MKLSVETPNLSESNTGIHNKRFTKFENICMFLLRRLVKSVDVQPFLNLSLLLNPITCKRSQKKYKIMLTNNLGAWYLRKLGWKSFQISSPFQNSMVQDACHCSPKSYHMQPVEKKKVMFSIHHILSSHKSWVSKWLLIKTKASWMDMNERNK